MTPGSDSDDAFPPRRCPRPNDDAQSPYRVESDGKDVLDAQGRGTGFDLQQAGDVGVLAGIETLVFGVLGKNFQPLLGCLDVDQPVSLGQMVVDRQRPLATSLVLDAGG